jgi:hypothetical protein
MAAFLYMQTAHSASAVGEIRAAGSFDRSEFANPDDEGEVRRLGNLKGSHWGVAGWAEYDFDVVDSGWYQIWVRGGAQEYFVDAAADRAAEPLAYFAGGSGVDGEPDKVGNVWLDAGRHRVRVQTNVWYGFSDFRSIELRRSTSGIEDSLAIPWPRAGTVFRAHSCPAFGVLSGNRRESLKLFIKIRDTAPGGVVITQSLVLPVSRGPVRQEFDVPCQHSGYFRVSVAVRELGVERELDWRAVKGFEYEVVDTAAISASDGVATESDLLVQSIDCTKIQPEYGSGESLARLGSGNRYRESGTHGWVPFQVLAQAAQSQSVGPSWFAYVLSPLVPGRRYKVEVDYPDDADRTFGIFVREAGPGASSVAIGVDTGGPYHVSNAMATTSLTFWPHSGNPRLVFASALEGTRATCAHIRVRETRPTEPLAISRHAPGTREFVNWYEEGMHFGKMFGAKDDSPSDISRAIDRWAGTVAAEGGTTLMPTAVVYEQQLYPSRFNLIGTDPQRDWLRRIVLGAERYHLKVIAELQPRADELMYGKREAESRRMLLKSADGSDDFFAADGKTRNKPPHYDVTQPEIQDWVVAMVGELADRYADSPAFEGISLRVMQWSNAALSNLVSLDWGYGDDTIRRFEADTGIRVPVAAQAQSMRFTLRHAWLTGAGQRAWMDWRCRKMTELYRRLVERVRQARSDLTLYVHVFPADEGRPFDTHDTPRERLREAGLDVDALGALRGLVLIDSSARYGRRSAGSVDAGLMKPIRDAAVINSLRAQGEGGHFIAAHTYLEATDRVIPPSLLGFPPDTSASWTSLAANPARRGALERFAVALAEGDALMLGDGGNAYVYSVAGLKEFLDEFTRLPARTFLNYESGEGPIAVRTLTDKESSWFYVVNRTPTSRLVDLEIDHDGAIDAASRSEVLNGGRHVRISLPAFGLYVGHVSGPIRLLSVVLVEKE